MVDEFRHKLTSRDLKHFRKCLMSLEKVHIGSQVNRVTVWGFSLKSADLHRYQKGRAFKIGKQDLYHEIVIDGKEARICGSGRCLVVRESSGSSTSGPQAGRMLNGSADKSIAKRESQATASPLKPVSVPNTYYVPPAGSRQPEPAAAKNYESMYKEYLQKVQMNGACAGAEQPAAASSSQPSEPAAPAAPDDAPPKRKRGRPKGSGTKRREEPAPAAPVVSPPVRKRGWPLGVPRKRRGRPRKLPEFGFHTIVADIKTITLPSELWSAHVSVTAKRSQVCFTRVVQAVSSAVPVECDRSVKFNGSLKHVLRINNRDVELLGAPTAVNCLRDVQTLLEIVDDIGINDPVLDYLHR